MTPVAYDGDSGMNLSIDGVRYYRDLQGRYYLLAGEDGSFFPGQVREHSPLWNRLQAHPGVIAETIRLAEWAKKNWSSHEHLKNPNIEADRRRKVFA